MALTVSDISTLVDKFYMEGVTAECVDGSSIYFDNGRYIKIANTVVDGISHCELDGDLSDFNIEVVRIVMDWLTNEVVTSYELIISGSYLYSYLAYLERSVQELSISPNRMSWVDRNVHLMAINRMLNSLRRNLPNGLRAIEYFNLCMTVNNEEVVPCGMWYDKVSNTYLIKKGIAVKRHYMHSILSCIEQSVINKRKYRYRHYMIDGYRLSTSLNDARQLFFLTSTDISMVVRHLSDT